MGDTLASLLLSGGIAVIPTDTLLGVVVRALDRSAVARLYRLRRKTSHKPFIILILDTQALKAFGVRPSKREERFLRAVWPGKVSVIFPVPSRRLAYLHRGTKTLAFRVPKSEHLRKLLKKTGPLLAPSANPEGLPPAKKIAEAKKYFGNKVDTYAGGSTRSQRPSTLISFVSGRLRIMRKGAVPVQTLKRLFALY